MAHVKLHHVERGEGAPVVLLHGFPFDHTIWQPQLDDSGTVARLLAPDLPGYGRSAPLRDQASMDAYADAVAEWARELRLSGIVLAGHSMGGYVAFAFVRRHAEMLRGLVLVATRPGPDSEAAKENRAKLADEVRSRGAQATVDTMHPKLLGPQAAERNAALAETLRQLMLQQSEEGIVAALQAMAARPDSSPTLDEIRVPTLIVAGTGDAIIPSSEAEAMASRISGAKYVPIDGAGHMPMMEAPSQLNKALRQYLRDL